MKKKILIVLLILTAPVFATENSRDLWYGFFNQSTINENLSWWTETQLRHDLDINQLQQALVRTGLLMKLTKTSDAGFLYAYVNTDDIKEHRLALQHTMTYGEFLNSIFSHRIRLEYRSLEGQRNLPERFRYFLRSQGISNYHNIKRVIWDEVFINLRKDSEINNRIFGINRFFIGGRYALTPHFNIELGYLNQFINRPQRNLMEHVLVLYLFFSS